MKRKSFLIVLAFVLIACNQNTVASGTQTPNPDRTNTLAASATLTATVTAAPTIPPTPLPITFIYEDSVPADGRRIQELAAQKAYVHYSQDVDLGPQTIYTTSNIDSIMDQVYPAIKLDGNLSQASLREGWPDTGGTAAEGMVLINQEFISWQDTNVCYKAKNVAHELFHNTQRKLLKHPFFWPEKGQQWYGPEWIKEGTADVMGFTIADGLNGCSYKENGIGWWRDDGNDGALLSELEGSDAFNKPKFWSVAPLGADYLVTTAPQGEKSVIQFYAEIGSGKGWRDAFRSAFGLSVEDFYKNFEAMRKQQAVQYDTSVCVKQTEPKVKCIGRKPNGDLIFNIPSVKLTTSDQWKYDSNCTMNGGGISNGLEENSYALILVVDASAHGACHTTVIFSADSQVTVDFTIGK